MKPKRKPDPGLVRAHAQLRSEDKNRQRIRIELGCLFVVLMSNAASFFGDPSDIGQVIPLAVFQTAVFLIAVFFVVWWSPIDRRHWRDLNWPTRLNLMLMTGTIGGNLGYVLLFGH